jgi:uncharacterized protein YwbE
MVSSPARAVWISQQIAKAILVAFIMKAQQYTGKFVGSHVINQRPLTQGLFHLL